MRDSQNLVPIEVKAKNGNAKSLKTLIISERYPDISYGITFSMGNIGLANNIYNFPYFCVFLLKRWLKSKGREQSGA